MAATAIGKRCSQPLRAELAGIKWAFLRQAVAWKELLKIWTIVAHFRKEGPFFITRQFFWIMQVFQPGVFKNPKYYLWSFQKPSKRVMITCTQNIENYFFAYFCLFFSCKVPHYKFSWFWHLLYIWSNVPEQYNKQEPVKSRLAGGSRDLTLLCQCLLEISLTSFCFIFSSKAYEKSLIQGCRYLASMTRKTFKNVSCQRVRSILP